MRTRFALILCSLPIAVGATEPLSVIEWLGQNPPGSGGPVLLEPPVSPGARAPEIDVTPLDQATQPVGLVPATVTGLPADLWKGSEVDTLIRLIAAVPVSDSPAMQKLLYTLLLTETTPPEGDRAEKRLLLARIDRLMELGATDPAQALAETAGPTDDAALFARWFDATLLTGAEDTSCEALTRLPHLAPDYAARIFCDARRGDWQTAALLLETAHVLELMPQARLDLLDRFLSPDIFEGAPPLPAPADPDPLDFRLFETIGERLPTAPLPRAFATADLRDVAGWKAQIEAAERLTRIGALSPNRLLGLYTEREASASGGVWDRVEAVQAFDGALTARDAAAVTRTLPPAWAAMRDVHLEVPFASLFADRLATVDLTDPAARDLAWRVRVLSPDLAKAPSPPGADALHRFADALATGDPTAVPAPDALAQAIADGFAAAPSANAEALPRGERILRAMAAFDTGRRGNPDMLSAALADLRALGLTDTARRAALQILLLGER
ncbi:hypothetical protein [Sedimentitalea arenosa]|uniref:Uncharacterized protein n=1 Tax=Sedimentitalea arenosa TaxID=2798803 RepID=A0A8J7LV32_9RHOB|nr:hypothetical protein [Arenibacterium arenosum]MBJ6370341.1 hypothetical protein [Arenibacterium arenosum]